MPLPHPRLVALAAVPLALAACSDGNPTGARQLRPADRANLSASALADTNGVIVTLGTVAPDGGIPEAVTDVIADQRAEILRYDRASRLVVVRGLKDADALAALPETDVLAPNLEHQLLTDQSGAGLYPILQQNLPHINVPAAWANTAFNGANTRVCIIDTGIDSTHPDLAGRVAADTSFIPNVTADNDGGSFSGAGHGTHVASTVVSNGIGMASVAPGAVLLAAKVFDNNGGGATNDRVFAAIRWCGRQGAHVINMSLGFNGGLARGAATDAVITLYQAAVNEVLTGSNPVGAGTGGSIVVASAGNDAARIPSAFRIWLPAELDNVVTVGSTLRSADTRSSFTNRGRSVDIYAPGSSILAVCSSRTTSCGGGAISTFNGARYMQFNGTSMAAPHVAGVTALTYSAYGGVRSAANASKVTGCVLARALQSRVAQAPDPAARRVDALRAQTGRGEGAAGCPL